MAEYDALFQPLQGLRVGDFIRKDLPPEAVSSVNALVDIFVNAEPVERERLTRQVKREFGFVFELFAYRTTIESVRQNDPTLLRLGLLALSIENAGRDYRDTLRGLAYFYHSACKLGISPAGSIW